MPDPDPLPPSSHRIPRWPARFGAAAAAGLAATLLTGLMLPIYTDEIGWRMMLDRSLLDGGVDRSMGEQCGPGTMIAAPWFMQPLRHVSAAISLAFDDPRWIRISGVALAIGWMGLLWLLTRTLPPRLRGTGRAIGYGLAGLGIVPLLLVWSRPEQPLLLAITLAALIMLNAQARPDPTGVGRALCNAALLLLLGTVMLGYHPKGVVFSPLIAVALLFSSRGAAATRAIRAVAITLLIALAATAYRYWAARLGCPGDPQVAARIAQQNLASGGLPPIGLAVRVAFHSLFSGYLHAALPHKTYMSGWLPVVPTSYELRASWQVVIVLGWEAAAIAGLVGIGRAAWRAWRERRLAAAPVMAAAIVADVLLWGATQLVQNAYEAALILPLLIMAILLALPFAPPVVLRWAIRGSTVLAAAALASEIVLVATYGPALKAASAEVGYTDAQPFSFSPWTWPRARAEVLAAGRACGIDPARSRPHHLLIDDVSYLAYLRSDRPLHRTALLAPWNGSIADPVAYLRGLGSSGGVVQCAILPPAVRAQARATGAMCCLGPFEPPRP